MGGGAGRSRAHDEALDVASSPPQADATRGQQKAGCWASRGRAWEQRSLMKACTPPRGRVGVGPEG